jgi:hypothetical protein
MSSIYPPSGTANPLALAKFWICATFNGSSWSIANSYNISSISQNASGDLTINFINSFSNSNYAVSLSIQDTRLTPGNISFNSAITNKTNSSVRIFLAYPALTGQPLATAFDYEGFMAIGFGN